jgi:hypothetical protein
MALNDIVAGAGDGQEFVVEIPAGNASYTPQDVLLKTDGAILTSEIPEATSGGGNIFIMSE